MDNVSAYYTGNIERYSQRVVFYDVRVKLFSWLRLLAFGGAVAFFILFRHASYGLLVSGGTLLVAGFFSLVWWHNALWKKRAFFQRLVLINQQEQQALSGDLDAFYPGTEYATEEHPYALDLDIFGLGSLFQLIDRTIILPGRHMLAHWLSHPLLDVVKLKQRQKVVEELAQQTDFRHQWRATAMGLNEKPDDRKRLKQWLADDDQFSSVMKKVGALLVTLFIWAVFILVLAGVLPVSLFFTSIVVPLAFAILHARKVNKIHQQVSRTTELLKQDAQLLALLENHSSWKSEVMKTRVHVLTSENVTSCQAIRRLSKITGMLDARLNIVVWLLLNTFACWDVLQVMRLEQWRRSYHKQYDVWSDTLAYCDAVCSLANLSFNYPHTIFPQLVDDDFIFEAEELKHPLIFGDKSIGNPMDIKGWSQFYVITGANMAGKSTYLRTVGVNMVLAMAGGVVYAQHMSLSPVQIFSGIRTDDSLQKHESYFFAELKRLQQLIQSLQRGQKLFIILDEILRGTNSADKQKGSGALLKQLIDLGASGIIATHDLALGDLKNQNPMNIENKRFEVEVSDDQMIFDYRLKEGISQNLNATILMRQMGITV